MTEGGLALPPELLGSTMKHAVYRCYSDGGELLYVGESGHLGKRLASHAEKAWFVEVRGITLEWYADELEALAAERRAIHVEHPKYNVHHRRGQLRAVKPKAVRRPPPAAVDARARKLLAQDPAMNGGELGRRLGVSAGYGRKLRRRLAEKCEDQA